jgi:hypothetical protein
MDAAGLSDQQVVQVTVEEVTRDPDWSVVGQVTNANCLSEGGAITLTVSGGFGALDYSWSNGATTKDLTDLNSGVHTVVITDIKGNQISQSYTVNTQPGPKKPSLFHDGNFLSATPAGSYQWSFNGVEIKDATSQTIELTLSGEYQVTIADEVGCTVVSDPFIFTVDHNMFNIYPVPTDGELKVDLSLKEAEIIILTVVDALGKQTPVGVYDLAAGNHNLTLDFNDSFANGVYMLMNNGKNFESNKLRFVLIR